MTHDGAIAYTDGSCIGNPGPGGWGVHVQFPDGRVVELGGGELRTTNNRMELRAAIEAVRATLGCATVTVVTDSSYVQRGITAWLPGWKANGWRTVAGQPVENQALWAELDALADDRVTWEWTRGHVGTVGNERCDAIARWFAMGVRRLKSISRRPARREPVRGGSRPQPGSASHDNRPAVPQPAYLSLVDGVLARHRTWDECERRVHGVRGARFRRVRNPDEEQAALAAWGLPADALDYP